MGLIYTRHNPNTTSSADDRYIPCTTEQYHNAVQHRRIHYSARREHTVHYYRMGWDEDQRRAKTSGTEKKKKKNGTSTAYTIDAEHSEYILHY